MPNPTRTVIDARRLLAAATLLCASPLATADYVPYPGKLAVNLLAVDAPNVVFVNFSAWPGYLRSVRVVLPGIAVPMDTAQASDCERDKAAKALAFTRGFVGEARTLHIKDLRMETSADERGTSDLLTDRGSLSQALLKEGLARASTVAAETAWCK